MASIVVTSKKIIGDVEVIQEGDVTHFVPVQTEKERSLDEILHDNRSWFGKIIDWFKGSKVTPYVKVRDFNNQGNDEMRYEDNESKNGVEAGIKIKF